MLHIYMYFSRKTLVMLFRYCSELRFLTFNEGYMEEAVCYNLLLVAVAVESTRTAQPAACHGCGTHRIAGRARLQYLTALWVVFVPACLALSSGGVLQALVGSSLAFLLPPE